MFGCEGGGGLIFVGVEVLFDAQVSAHVAEWFFGEGEFAQMIAPCIGTRAAPGVSLAGYGGDGSIRFAPGKGLVVHLEGDMLAGFPEGGGELVGEEEGEVAALGAEGFHRLLGGLPGQPNLRDVPFAELEAVGPGLRDEQMQQFETSHKRTDYCANRCATRRQGAMRDIVKIYRIEQLTIAKFMCPVHDN